jgi:hypothetical protein
MIHAHAHGRVELSVAFAAIQVHSVIAAAYPTIRDKAPTDAAGH